MSNSILPGMRKNFSDLALFPHSAHEGDDQPNAGSRRDKRARALHAVRVIILVLAT
ncbi:MAG: hypothetical protein ACJ788_09985 [Ktedonobacteraceae bacterium]